MSLGTHDFNILGDRHLDKVLEWVFSVPWETKLKRFTITNDDNGRPCLLLSSYEATSSDGWNALPAPMDAAMAAPLIVAWLENIDKWPPEPDIDGHCRKGWRITDSVADITGARGWSDGVFCVVRPEWTEYHK